VSTDYAAFLAAKAQAGTGTGFEPNWLPDWLFGFQGTLVDWSVRMGRAAVFADCGLGKTPMQLAWAQNVQRTPASRSWSSPRSPCRSRPRPRPRSSASRPRSHATGPCRLASRSPTTSGWRSSTRPTSAAWCATSPAPSSPSTASAGRSSPSSCAPCRTGCWHRHGGPERLHRAGHVQRGPRLPRPHGHAQPVLHQRPAHQHQAVRTWDGAKWRLKGHAAEPFWRWVASWARAIRKPSDSGSTTTTSSCRRSSTVHVVAARTVSEGTLFDTPAVGLHEEREEARRTLTERCEKAAEVLADADTAVAWCHLNDEGAADPLIDGAVEIAGSDSPEAKEDKLLAFSRGQIRVLVTKPVIGAWGLNWQHCHRMTYFPSHSYEQYYQAVRRSWRFGQSSRSLVDLITTEGGPTCCATCSASPRPGRRNVRLAARAHAPRAVDPPGRRPTTQSVEVPAWLPCPRPSDHRPVRHLQRRLPGGAAGCRPPRCTCRCTRPPFATEGGGALYHYSSSDRDLSNARTYAEFFEHYGFVVAELTRVTMPGRITAVHCTDVPPATRAGTACRLPRRHHPACTASSGSYVARYHIWKEPLAVRNRTMAKNLAHKTIVDDSSRCSQRLGRLPAGLPPRARTRSRSPIRSG
jgi:hypothetical protein